MADEPSAPRYHLRARTTSADDDEGAAPAFAHETHHLQRGDGGPQALDLRLHPHDVALAVDGPAHIRALHLQHVHDGASLAAARAQARTFLNELQEQQRQQRQAGGAAGRATRATVVLEGSDRRHRNLYAWVRRQARERGLELQWPRHPAVYNRATLGSTTRPGLRLGFDQTPTIYSRPI